MRNLRGILFSVGALGALLVCGLVVILFIVAPLSWRYAVANAYCRFVLFWLRVTCGIDADIEGAPRLGRGGVVVLSNHQSSWETFALQQLVRAPVWVAKRELFWLPLFGWGLAALRAVAIDRSSGKEAMNSIVRNGATRLRQGHSVVIFPEGTRVAPETRKRYKLGGAVLAVATGVPVVPVAHNAGRFWGRRRLAKSPGTVRLRVGEPIASAGKTAEQLMAEVESWIRGACADIDQADTAPAASADQYRPDVRQDG